MARPSLKKTLIVAHDLLATAAAVVLTFVVRFEGPLFDERIRHVPALLPPFLAYAGLVYWFFALYRSKWRFASLPDLANIVRAASVLALTLLVLDYILVSPQLYGIYFFGKIAIFLYWLLQIVFLGGPRLAYRYLKYSRSRSHVAREATTPTLLLGRAGEVEVLLRAIEAGSVKKLSPRGILSPRGTDAGQSLRGVPVLGGFADLEAVVEDFSGRGTAVRRLVATPSALMPEAHPEDLLARARRLGLPIARLTSLGEGLRDAEIAPLEIEDLLLRPTVEIDRDRLTRFLAGRRVLVTGGGGSIGAEICARAVTFGAADVVVLESSEPALHGVLGLPALASRETRVEGVLADVRDSARVRQVFADVRPDYVFHAAALKQVPYLERDWTEGVKTNVFGSANVAEAAIACGARAVVMISTDKAIEPVSQLGATKRLAEMVAQALDAERAGDPDATRLIAVRFGNVLGSVGSVVPTFKAQIARGGPVTVTHPEMVRYFMTTREAADLVLTAASHADGEARAARAPEGERPAVYVLKMGQPVRIQELAERMIRLAGYEPGTEIEIAVTGVRPGERLNEILFGVEEPRVDIGIDGVMAAKPFFADRARVETWLSELRLAVNRLDRARAEAVFAQAIPDFSRRAVPSASPSAPPIPLGAPRAATIRGA